MKIKCIIHPGDITEDYMVSAKNAQHLKYGQTYTLASKEVENWFTTYYLEEFPGIMFNSVWFGE